MCELTNGMAGERHGRGTAWERHAMCESAFTVMCVSNVLTKHGLTAGTDRQGVRLGPYDINNYWP
jgi:hypothetical protein